MVEPSSYPHITNEIKNYLRKAAASVPMLCLPKLVELLVILRVNLI